MSGETGEAQALRITALMALFFLMLPTQAQALTPSEVFERVQESVFVVRSFDAQDKPMSFGSAVLLPSGKIATNCHVLEGGTRFILGRGSRFVPATLYAANRDKDLCLLVAEIVGAKPTQLGKTANLKVGSPIYAIGSPQGLELSLSNGIVAQLRGGTPPLIQITAPISPGSSGGGLFDSEGQLVGLTTLYIHDGQNLNFALPIEWIEDIKHGATPSFTERSQIDWKMGAIALEDRKDWAGMLNWSEGWVNADPKNAKSWLTLGIAYMHNKRTSEAIDAYHRAVRIDPELAYAWYSLGGAYADQKLFPEAIDAYGSALRINNEDMSAWYNLGIVYAEQKNFTEAIDAFRAALRIDPKHARAWFNLAVAYGQLDRGREEIEAYREALRIDPEYSRAWHGLGLAYSAQKKFAEEIDAYRQALRIDPEYASAWFHLGLSYGAQKRFSEEIDAYRQALRIDSENASTWYTLGVAYSEQKRFPEAIDAYRQALRIDPKYASAWNNLAIAYFRSGNRTAALVAVRNLRSLDPVRAERVFDLIVPR
jgi:tetratricopeptide (TPR) repeat protein